MSITGGVFNETTLANIQVKSDKYWSDAIQKQDYVADCETIKALKAQQTAKFGKFLTGPKDRTVEISWMNACDIDDQACTYCTFSGNELSTNMDEKYLSQCREVVFSVNEKDFVDNVHDFEEAIAKGFLTGSKVLDEWWAARAVVALNAAKGVNEVGDGSKGDVSGTDTYVLPAYWDADLMAYFYLCAKVNKFVNPFLISGKNLFESKYIAQIESCCENEAKKFGAFQIYFDLFNIDSANNPDYVTYMIHKGAFAFVTKAYYKSTPSKYMEDWRWSMPSRNIPGVVYDVHYKNECNTSDGGVTHYYKLITYGDIFLNPRGCTETRTGVLSFICGEPEA